MAFTVSGNLKKTGRFASVTWADGKLSGDPEAIGMAASRAITHGSGRKRLIGHIGEIADLERPIFAAYILGLIFVPGTYVYEGDVPQSPPIPEGGVS